MCGIFCVISKSPININLANNSLQTLKHRGPDNNNYWTTDDLKTFIGHTRLSIVDLASSGNQPFHSQNGRYVISFNGEIYNFKSIKDTLIKKFGVKFFGTGDTEVLTEAIAVMGLNKTLEIVNGMFSIAVYDRKIRKLFLIRDRAGEKPLYYYLGSNEIVIASELKAIKKFVPNLQIAKSSIYSLIRNGFIDESECIYQKTYKVHAGEIIEINIDSQVNINKTNYWKYGLNSKSVTITPNDAAEQVYRYLKDAIKLQLETDVKTGVFLSGGIDSTIVTAIAQMHSMQTIKTFSIGFNEETFDESKAAHEAASLLGTDHKSFILTGNKANDIFERLSFAWDEPFADSSQIPTLYLCKEASNEIKVAMTGDGADELFCGYQRYKYQDRLSSFSGKSFLKIYKLYSKIFSRQFQNDYGDLKAMTRLVHIASMQSEKDIYRSFISLNSRPQRMINFKELIEESQSRCFENFNLKECMADDFQNYLPSDILTKIDRAGMSYSIETRMPFLDKNIISLAESLPITSLYYKNDLKHILKIIYKDLLPQKMMQRKKKGFSVPMGKWMREELKKKCEYLIYLEKGKEGSIFDWEYIRRLWEIHLSGKKDLSKILWPVISYQNWAYYNS